MGEVALTGAGVGEGGIVEKQLAMDEKLNTLITNQANIEMVQGGLVNTVNTLSLALSRMEGKLQTVDTTVQTINSTVQTINYDGVAPTVQTIDTEVGYIYDYFCGATGFNGPCVGGPSQRAM